MDPNSESASYAVARGRVKMTAIMGMVLFFVGAASTVATWVLRDEVWIVSGIVTLVGAFLFTHALIARSTKMG